MSADADQNGRTDEVLQALLEDDEEDFKELIGPGEPPKDLLRDAIRRKEIYLGYKLKKVGHAVTNRLGETFVFGQFGNVMSTLLYFNPETGWQIAGQTYNESLEDEDFKELLPEPKKYLPLGYVTNQTSENILIQAFLDLLEKVDPKLAKRWHEQWEDREVDESYLAYEVLPDKLNNYCLPFTYFGQYESDSDWGVWVNREQINEFLEEKPDELQSAQQGEPVPQGSKYVVILNREEYPVALLNGETGSEIWHVNY